jgi:adenosylmethionine-8-amino-7-oxononanoate aminotransferase
MSLAERDLNVLWHPCSQMRDYIGFPPLEIVSAQGSWLHLADGRRVLDAISSWWCKALGHGHPRLRAALIEQAGKFEHVILANTTNDGVVRFCERILRVANAGRKHFGKVFFADNGSTAVEVALKMALQAQAQSGRPQRTKFAGLRNGYHGETVGALSVSDCGLYKEKYAPLLFDCAMIDAVPYRSGESDPAWLDASREWANIELQLDAMADDLAAIIYEPVLQGAGGMRLYSPDLLKRLSAWARAHDVFLIADEIAAGMGRLGAMLAGHLAGDAPPDFAVLSKGLTAGFLPLSVVLTTDAVYDVFHAEYAQRKAFLHSNTFAGNALAVAAANAVLDVFAEEKILEGVARNGPLLRSGLEKLADTSPHLKNVRGLGMMAAADLCAKNGADLDWKARTGYRVFQEAVKRGALLRPLGDTMYLFPPLNSTCDEIDQMIAILGQSVDAVCLRA